MFSPSLISMILHKVLPEKRASGAFDPKAGISYKTSWDLAQPVSDLASQFTRPVWPRLPIVGRLTYLRSEFQPQFFKTWFDDYVRVDRSGDVTFFWGRVPVDLLARQFRELHEAKAEDYYVDLGTTVRVASSVP